MTDPGKFAAFGPDLVTPADLLRKLENDYERVQRNTRDTYAAFDFFVTAEHMVDWVRNKPLRNTVPLLKIVSHLATGAKHFIVTNPKHTSVSGLGINGEAFQADAFQTSAFQTGFLAISLMGEEAVLFGPIISVSELADKVRGYWRENVGASNNTNQPAPE
jgi:hypothetical protein